MEMAKLGRQKHTHRRTRVLKACHWGGTGPGGRHFMLSSKVILPCPQTHGRRKEKDKSRTKRFWTWVLSLKLFFYSLYLLFHHNQRRCVLHPLLSPTLFHCDESVWCQKLLKLNNNNKKKWRDPNRSIKTYDAATVPPIGPVASNLLWSQCF